MASADCSDATLYRHSSATPSFSLLAAEDQSSPCALLSAALRSRLKQGAAQQRHLSGQHVKLLLH